MKKKKQRNEFVLAMKKSRKGGPMRNKKDKRKRGRNKIKDYLDEKY